jgi:hypothetical protein
MDRARALLLLVAMAAACHSRLSPEQRVRQAIQGVVKAAAARDLKPIAAFVSDRYADDEHNDKQQVVSLVRVQFVLHPNLYLVTKIASLACPAPAQADVVLFAAMASVPASGLSDLSRWSGDVYRFELALVDENGTWRVRRASWTQASVQDLLHR